MTRTGKIDTPGRSSDQKFGKSGYQSQSIKNSKNQFMRSFSRSKSKLQMTAFDSNSYCNVFNINLYVASSAGAAITAFTNAWDKTWEYGHKQGNMKDLVGAQETALGLVTCNMLQIVFDLTFQKILRELCPVLTEADASNYWLQTTFDNFVNQLEGMPMPTFVANFVKSFAYYIKISDQYQLHNVTVPPSFIVPFVAVGQASHAAAQKIIVESNLAQAIAQAEKFGIPMTKFSASMIEAQEISDDHSFARAFFNHVSFKFYDNGTNDQCWVSPAGPMGVPNTNAALNMTTDYTGRKFFFPSKSNGPDSIVDGLAPMLGVYDGTNNKNGGWFVYQDAGAAEYRINISHCAHYATSLTGGLLTTVADILIYLLAFWTGVSVTDGDPSAFIPSVYSDKFTDVVGGSDVRYGQNVWPYAVYHDLMYGTTVTYTQSLDFLINNLVRLTYGG